MILEKILVELAKQVAETKALAHASALAQQEILANLSGRSVEEVHATFGRDLDHWKKHYLTEVLASVDMPGPDQSGQN